MCILVVEDEPLIREILVEELEDAGYDVRSAATGDEAIDLLPTLSTPLRLLVTDIHMPGSHDGIALANHVRALMPHIPIIYTTGQPNALSFLQSMPERNCLVRKPYVPRQIIEKICELLPNDAPICH